MTVTNPAGADTGAQKSVEERTKEMAASPAETITAIINGLATSGDVVPVVDRALIMVIKRILETGGKLQPALIDTLVAEIHAKLALQTDAILHNPDFQKLEAAWRGLFYLVDNTDFRKGVKIDILDVSKDDLISDLRDNPDTTRTAYYGHIYSQGIGSFRGTPIGAVIANYEFGPGQNDIWLLKKCDEVASMGHAPFISAAAPSMFAVENFNEVPGLADIDGLFEGAKFAAWRGFRDEADA